MIIPAALWQAGAEAARQVACTGPQALTPEIVGTGYLVARKVLKAENASAILALAGVCQKLGIDTLRIIRLPGGEGEPQDLEIDPRQLEQLLR